MGQRAKGKKKIKKMTYRSNDNLVSFVCLASSSSGNAYVMAFPNNRHILVECGLSYHDLLSKMISNNAQITNIKSCLITHSHNDHSLSKSELLERNIDVWANSATLSGIDHKRAHIVESGNVYEILPDLFVKPFDVQHDTSALGFMIHDKVSKKTIMFINDTKTFDTSQISKVPIDYLFIECNHIRKQLEAILKAVMEHAQGNEDDPIARNKIYKFTRQAHYHLSLAGTKKVVRELNKTQLKGIFLMHLSDDIANEYVMKMEIEKVFKIPTYVCGKKGGIK